MLHNRNLVIRAAMQLCCTAKMPCGICAALLGRAGTTLLIGSTNTLPLGGQPMDMSHGVHCEVFNSNSAAKAACPLNFHSNRRADVCEGMFFIRERHHQRVQHRR